MVGERSELVIIRCLAGPLVSWKQVSFTTRTPFNGSENTEVYDVTSTTFLAVVFQSCIPSRIASEPYYGVVLQVKSITES